jgi:hypothetical protein
MIIRLNIKKEHKKKISNSFYALTTKIIGLSYILHLKNSWEFL